MQTQVNPQTRTEEVVEDLAPVATDPIVSDQMLDDIDEVITEVEESFDDILISAVRGEKVQRIRQHGRTAIGSRAWTMGGSVD